MQNTIFKATTQKVGVLIGNKFDDAEVTPVLDILFNKGIIIEVISDKLGTVKGENGRRIEVDKTFLQTHPTLLDSLYVVGGKTDYQANFDEQIYRFTKHAYKHYKPIRIATTGYAYLPSPTEYENGVVYANAYPTFIGKF